MVAGDAGWSGGVRVRSCKENIYFLQNKQFLEQPWVYSSDRTALRDDTPSQPIFQVSNITVKVALRSEAYVRGLWQIAPSLL